MSASCCWQGSRRRWRCLVCGLRIADGIGVLLGEEGHSDSDFLLIFSYDGLENGNEISFLLRILLIGNVSAELAQEIDIVHEVGSPPSRNIFLQGEGVGNTGISVWDRTEVLAPGHCWLRCRLRLSTLFDLSGTPELSPSGQNCTACVRIVLPHCGP